MLLAGVQAPRAHRQVAARLSPWRSGSEVRDLRACWGPDALAPYPVTGTVGGNVGAIYLARHRLPVAVGVVSGVLVIAGCGGSKPSSTGKRPSSPSSYARSQIAAANCIRSHGVPNFPDPTFGAGGAQVNLSSPRA
jgi:hypothetical protein